MPTSQAAEHFGVGAALVAAVKELQGQGYALPNYPSPSTDAEKKAVRPNDAIKGPRL